MMIFQDFTKWLCSVHSRFCTAPYEIFTFIWSRSQISRSYLLWCKVVPVFDLTLSLSMYILYNNLYATLLKPKFLKSWYRSVNNDFLRFHKMALISSFEIPYCSVCDLLIYLILFTNLTHTSYDVKLCCYLNSPYLFQCVYWIIVSM
jgi:hypothetical protein